MFEVLPYPYSEKLAVSALDRKEEKRLKAELQSHAETYGLSLEAETWYCEAGTCAVIYLMAYPSGNRHCVTAIARLHSEERLHEWPRDSVSDPIAGRVGFFPEVLHEKIDAAVEKYQTKAPKSV